MAKEGNYTYNSFAGNYKIRKANRQFDFMRSQKLVTAPQLTVTESICGETAWVLPNPELRACWKCGLYHAAKDSVMKPIIHQTDNGFQPHV